MGIFNYIETFFFISLGITFVLILLLVYHFKERIANLEEKNNTMFDIVNNIFNELSILKQSLIHKQYYEISTMPVSQLNKKLPSDIVSNIEVPMVKSQIEIITEPSDERNVPIKSVETDTIWENSQDENESDEDESDEDESGEDESGEDEDKSDKSDEDESGENTSVRNDNNLIITNDNETEPTLVMNENDIDICVLVNNNLNEHCDPLHNDVDSNNNDVLDEIGEYSNDYPPYSNVFIDDINKRIQELDRPSILDDLTTLSESCNIMDDLLNLSQNDNTGINHYETKNDPLKEVSHDYKKLNLTQLKQLVVAKGLTTDTSKLKKHELLKLLE